MIHTKTELNIVVSDSGSCKFLSIMDKSYYNPDIPVQDPKLAIKAPSSETELFFTVKPNTEFILNSNHLGITNTLSAPELKCLPDGNYSIRYMICPHDQLFTKLNYFNICTAYGKLMEMYCELDLPYCDTDSIVGDVKLKLSKLEDIERYLKAAKYMAEECNEPIRATKLYRAAIGSINKYGKNCDAC